MNTKQVSIGRDAAVALAGDKWWEGKTPREIVQFQLFIKELCMPFPVFRAAVESALGRGVQTIEFAAAFDSIVSEFLGEKPLPSLADILAIIPVQKRPVVFQGEARI